MLLPTIQMSADEGGLNKSGPRPPENPPPAAMMPTLTPTPTAANIAVMIATRRVGDIVMIHCRGYLCVDLMPFRPVQHFC
jgi:hypothetical protein